MLKDKNILITGGAGFIGTKIIRTLIEHNQITVLDNLRRDALTHTPLMSHPNLRFVKGDIRNSELVGDLVQDKTHIIHLASIAGVQTVSHNPMLTMDVTIRGTFNILEAATTVPGLERFVDVSTSEVFGVHASDVCEQDHTPVGPAGEPRWTYAAAKLATEHLCHAVHREHALPAVVIRPFNIFGPGQVGEGAIHHFVTQALANEPLTVHNGGTQIRAWCFVDDFVDGLLRTLRSPAAVGRTFNIGNPQAALTVHQLASLILRLTESASSVKFVKRVGADVALRIPDIHLAARLLDFCPAVDLESGLRQTISWYRKHSVRPLNSRMPEMAEMDSIAAAEGANNYGPH